MPFFLFEKGTSYMKNPKYQELTTYIEIATLIVMNTICSVRLETTYNIMWKGERYDR